MATYFKRLEGRYLASGPAPLGRILNYIKKVRKGQYRTSYRGPGGPQNLDNWTICFMVGLGLLKKPTYSPRLILRLTRRGKKIYNLIKNLPDFPDSQFRARFDTMRIKSNLKSSNPGLYNRLREILLRSDPMKNLALFLRIKGKNRVEKKEFKEYGEIFEIGGAWYNRLPSLWQMAEFCDVLEFDSGFFRIYDASYVKDFTISSSEEAEKKAIRDSVKEIRRRERKPQELDIDEESFLEDIPTNLPPQKRKVISTLVRRNSKIAKKLKILYNGECQICGFTFKKKDGENYAETHHLIPLGDSGSDSISNIVILCPNCHSQLTYASVELGGLGSNKRDIKINNVQKEIRYHPRHFQATRRSDIPI